MTANGHVPIECIKSGDYVYSVNIETGEHTEKEVLATYVRESNLFVHLWMGGEELHVTPNHRFYVLGKKWVEARALVAGDRLSINSDGFASIRTAEYETLGDPVPVYNFQVYDFQSYYVGSVGVLVHNGNCEHFTEEQQKLDRLGKEYKKSGGISRSDAEAFVDSANAANYPARIDEGHPTRSPANQQPHFHYGNGSNHIPIID